MSLEKVVAIGGDTGTYTLLRGMKKYPVDITAVVSMADDGGSTGKLRDEYGILPPGDVRRCLIALSDSSQLMKKLFEYRFDRGAFNGHSFGNLLITALREVVGDYGEAVKEASKILNVRGKVLPVTLDNVRLYAKLENGETIVGETNIDIPKHDPSLKIENVYLKPTAIISRDSYDSILQADKVVLGPGDLYTSIIPNLLVNGVKEILKESKAKKIYVCNLMTKYGETNGFCVSDFVSEIEKYVGNDVLDFVVYNESNYDKKLLEKYKEENAYPVRADNENFNKFKAEFKSGSFVREPVLIRHDSEKLASFIMGL